MSWLPGKKNLIAEVLSCNPCDVDYNGKKKLDKNCASDNNGISIKAIVTLGTITNRIHNVVVSCPEYQAVNHAFFDSGVVHLSYWMGIQCEDLVACGVPFQGLMAFSVWMHGTLGAQLSVYSTNCIAAW